MNQNIPGQQIFDYITSLLATQDFKQALAEFFEKNCHNFEDQEENKHIYKTIHEEYQQVLDASLEAKLIEKFSEKEINEFFENFENNYKNYQNQETVDTLFSFTDFEKFKKMMLEYNTKIHDVKDNTKESGVNISKDQNFGVYEKYYKKDLKEWDHVLKGKTIYDMSLYTTPFENSGLNMARAIIMFKDVSLDSVKYVMSKSDENMMKDNKRVKESKILFDSENEQITYNRISPPVITDREMLQQTTSQQISQSKALVIAKSIDHKNYPIQKDAIRAEQFRAVRLEQKGKDVEVDSIAYTDLKGYIPKMFMNMMLTKLVTQIMKKQYERAQIREKQKAQK